MGLAIPVSYTHLLRQGTRKGIRRTPANSGMRAHWVVKGLDIDVYKRQVPGIVAARLRLDDENGW